MPAGKVAVGVGLLAVVALAAAGLVALDAALLAAEKADRNAPGDVRVTVLLPDGRPLFNATVPSENGTALSVLLSAAAAGGFEVVVDNQSLGAYVRAIAGHEASGAEGWKYYVQHAGVWEGGDRTSADYPVGRGDWVLWRWGGLEDEGPWTAPPTG
ncbi:MAG TPA: hypothetical protein VNZ52_03785 [Candidatus Thermoplasmatota archaeon]|nr:hypothetical protein [Candidatus Thermoplasmatota archaeon]